MVFFIKQVYVNLPLDGSIGGLHRGDERWEKVTACQSPNFYITIWLKWYFYRTNVLHKTF